MKVYKLARADANGRITSSEMIAEYDDDQAGNVINSKRAKKKKGKTVNQPAGVKHGN